MNAAEDERLLADIRAGRREACATLIHRYYERIYRFLLHLAQDAASAEDLTQDTFSTVWQKIAAFEGRSSLSTWLHRIAYGKFVDARRRIRRGAELLEYLQQETPAPEMTTPLDAAIAGDENRHLYAQMHRLEPRDRAVLVLHYLQGLSYREMAVVVDEPANTVKWRVRAALELLRQLFAEGAKRHEHEPIE